MKLAAFEREALLADVLGVQVALEAFGGRQAIQDVLLLVDRERRRRAGRLQALLPPALLFRITDVHVLGADRAAVRVAQTLDDVAQRSLVEAEVQVACAVGLVEVAFGEVVERGFELGNGRAFAALQRIEIGPLRAEEAVGADQRLDVHLLACGREIAGAFARDEGIGLSTLGERFDDREMRNVIGVGAVRCRHVLQRVEILASSPAPTPDC